MKRTTIFADENLINEIKELSREENISVAEIIRKAMKEYIMQKRRTKKRTFSIIGVGASGRSDIAERHEELLFEELRKWKQ